MNDDCAAAHRALRARVTALAERLDEATLATAVPATPGWRVHDLLAHLVGVTVDVGAGRTDDAGSDDWTATQVEQRRQASLGDLLAEWDAAVPAFTGALVALDPFHARQVVFDATTHEHDLRGALGRPGARDTDGVSIAWGWSLGIVGQLRDGYGAGALRIRTELGDEVVGDGEVTGGVAGDRFELWRAMTGRRSREQVLAFGWEGEPALGHLCFLPARATALVE